MTEVGKKYPLTEALCEFFFVPQEDWDMTIPGIIYNNIQDKFPIKRQEVGKGVAFRPNEKGVLEQKLEPIPPRLLFFNQPQDILMQVSPNVLSVNVFRAVLKWDVFKSLIKYALNQYVNAAEPEGFDKIGLRYITRFDINDVPANMDKYLRIYPQIPPEFPKDFEEYELSLRINYREKRDYILLHSEISEIMEKEKTFSLLFDINYCMDRRYGIRLSELEEWLDYAHKEVRHLFSKSLTERCKNIFEVGELG
ncbi:MAG: TIGR04255 family protein [Firmicutes bacterium]|nr:TIGR04255 family protein [Bacillota bacterium]